MMMLDSVYGASPQPDLPAEGPAADFWYYADKDVYLRSALSGGLVIATATMAPFFARGWRSGLGAIVAILALGFTQMKGLAGLF